MIRPQAALFPIALALGAIILLPEASAREPTPIKACQTISKPGSYELANDLPPITPGLPCLMITADFVTIDLGGFSMTGSGNGAGVLAQGRLYGIAVRNGSISGYGPSVDLGSGGGSIVEGLRVSGAEEGEGIIANGIVRGNIAAVRFTAIRATGTVTGNYATSGDTAIDVGPNSTVIDNNASGFRTSIGVGAGSTVIGNTATQAAAVDLVSEFPLDVPPT